MSAVATVSAAVAEEVAVPRKDVVIRLKYHSTVNPSHRFLRTIRVVGYDEPLGAQKILNLVQNPHSGHFVAVAHRAKWQKRQHGRMADWRCYEAVAEEVDAVPYAKKCIDIADSEIVQEKVTRPPEPVVGTWEGEATVMVMAGVASLRSTSESQIISADPIRIAWSLTGTSEMLKGMGEKDAALSAIRSVWEERYFDKYGALDAYHIIGTTFGWSKVDAFQRLQFDR